MKSRQNVLAVLVLLLISSLSFTGSMPSIAAQSATNEALDEPFARTPKDHSADFTDNVNRSEQVFEGFSRKNIDRLEPMLDKTLENFRETIRNSSDEWDFNDTSGWSDYVYVEGNMTRLVVGVNSEKSSSFTELENLVATHGARIVSTVIMGDTVRAAVVELPLTAVTPFIEEARVAGLASYIEPSMKVQIQLVPNDPYWSYQWGPQKIEADWAWNITLGDPSILVAVVDTGVDYTHPDLAANYVPLGYDWAYNDTDPMDDFGHGTHVAGTIAAVVNNSEGIAGLAQVRIMAEKVLESRGWGYSEWIASGIIHAVDQGADIISMSLGGYGYSELVHEAVKYAYDSGVLVIAAAGNDDTDMRLYPAGHDEVVAVAATDQWDSRAWFSNWGSWIELAAPGVDIYSTVPGGYAFASGTSMATPHVSGVAALIWSQFPNKTRDWVRLWLRYTAVDLGDPGFDVYYGHGRVNARKAVEQSPPAHELVAYEWRTPPYVEPTGWATINATVLNFGENNETDIAVQLLANDTIVDSVSIGFLPSGEAVTISLTWNPLVIGLYNVTFYVVPVVGEANLENNVLWKLIYVGVPVKAVVLHSAGNILGDIITNWNLLNNEWYRFGDRMVYIDFETLNKDDITYEDIVATDADVLIISCAYNPWIGWEFTDSEVEAIERYVLDGHGLIATAGTLYEWVPNNNKLAPLFGLNEKTMWSVTLTDLLHILNTTHPLFKGVPNPFVFADVSTAVPFDGRWDSNELVDGDYLASGHFQESAIVTYRGLVYISPWLEVIPPYYHHHLQLLYNAIKWSRYQKPEHELVVSIEAPNYIEPGQSVLLNATVSNIGLNNETGVELQLLINDTLVDSVTISELPVGSSHVLSYLWAPTLEGIYNLTTYAPPVLAEELTSNNMATKMVRVRPTLGYILFDQTHATDILAWYSIWLANLTERGYVVETHTYGPVTSILLEKYDIFVVPQARYPFSTDELFAIQQFVLNGGGLLVIGDDNPWIYTDLTSFAGITWEYGGHSGYTSDITLHPVTEGVNTAYFGAPISEMYVFSPAISLIRDKYGSIMLAASEDGFGKVLGIADESSIDDGSIGYADNFKLAINMIDWLARPRYEHDLGVSLSVPRIVELGSSVMLNATVLNRGLNNETEVELYLEINGDVKDFDLIPKLDIGSSYTLGYLWTPTIGGIYNVTAYAPPLTAEEFTANNVVSEMVRVRYALKLLVVDTPVPEDTGALDKLGYNYTLVSSTKFATVDLYEFNVLFVGWIPGDAVVDSLVARASEIADWVSLGNGIVALSEIFELNRWAWLPLWVYSDAYGGEEVHILNLTHPVMLDLTDGELSYWWASYHGVFNNYHANWSALAEGVEAGYPITLAAEYGYGRMAVTHQDPDYHFYYDNNRGAEKLLRNMIEWAVPMARYEHDVAVVNVTSSINEALAGDTVDISVVAENQGNFTEGFTVTAYASSLNSTRIYFDPSSYAFNPSYISIGYRFNVTLRVEDVADLYAWEVRMYFNDTVINVTRWFEPTWDPVYVFYGKPTLPVPTPPEVAYKHLGPGNGSATVGVTLFGLPPTFTGDGLLFILEFEITAVPPSGESLSSELDIENRNTILLDSYLADIPSHKENGYYYLGTGAPPPPMIWYRIGVETVTDLAPGERITLTFAWNTTLVVAGDYLIWAKASVVERETDTADNKYTDGVVKIKRPPTAKFTYSPTFPKPGGTLTFNAAGSTSNGGTIVSYSWNFGDGNMTAVTVPIITHTYTLSGYYNVSLTVTDSEGLTDLTWKMIYVVNRDIALIDVAPSTNRTYIGRIVEVNVTVLNEGEVTETFDLILYYNVTAGDVLGTQTVINLTAGEQRTLTFLWNTSSVEPCHDYTVTAYAMPVLGETDVSDNTLSSSISVKVNFLGDINGDGEVDIRDISIVARAYGSYLGHPRWNPEADFNGDNSVDIRDLSIAARNFGKCIT